MIDLGNAGIGRHAWHTSDASGWEEATMPRVPNTGERRLLKSIRLKGLLPPPTDISLAACLAPPA